MLILLQSFGFGVGTRAHIPLLFLSKGYKKQTPSKEPGLLQKLRAKLMTPEEASERPSDLEIASKGLPSNTPTMGERARRGRCHALHIYDRKGGYYDGESGTWRDHVQDLSAKETLIQGAGVIKEEIRKWKDEVTVNKLEEWLRPGDRKYLYHSKGTPQEANREFVKIADSDWGEGFSTCSLEKHRSSGKIHFSGNLVTRAPRDGRTAYAGYANISTKNTHKSFFRVKPLDWHLYTHLVIRLRGDGRVYMLNVNTWEEYDIAWMDLYNYPLFTRGGPYWQEVKIPFSKFIFTHRGSIQDKQNPLTESLRKAYKLGITLKDQTDGPFSLEIDYIGVEFDNDDKQEESAYESYRLFRKNYTQM
uniref:Probable complex I intermediate-associated protein 30, mitochondrial n=1 Tax=Caligus clemensi TaxID=344056 RepID=C1C1W0_CALCM|nr:Probable complex I intermediate-associated protein 30, mitochondrial precursor [Caligus clemensi]